MLGKITRQTRKTFVAMSSGAKTGVVAATTLLALATASLVYATGGVQFAYLHLMYIPVVLSGLAFGVRGGVLAGIAGGLLLGPFMPLNTSMGAMQQPLNWIYRLISFALIGTLVGAGAQLLRRQLRELEWLHEHHPETGLLNLAGLLKELDDMMGNVTGRRELVLSIMQLNNFLEIQNTFGAAFGMRVLAQVIDRAQRLMPSGSLLALVQPDRLGSVIPGEEALQTMRERVEAAVKESYLVDGVPIHVAASIGVALGSGAESAEDLLRNADVAMYAAKQSSRGGAEIFRPGLRDGAAERSARAERLRGLEQRDELRLDYQPIVELSTGVIVAVEALVRWQPPEGPVLLPGEWIDLAEETGDIVPIGRWILREACRQARDWQIRLERPELRISVNLSARQFLEHDIVGTVRAVVEETGLPPTSLMLEITESGLMRRTQATIARLSDLRALGVHLAIDDFGTGYSSLSYLERFPIDVLKIDRTFVATVGNSPSPIARAVLDLGRTLNLEVIAEGIEHAEQARWLADLGCRFGQGYLFARPVGAPALEAMLAEGAGLMAPLVVDAPAAIARAGGVHKKKPRLRLVSGE